MGNFVLDLFRGRPRQCDGSAIFPARPLPLHSMISSFGINTAGDPSYDWHGLKRGNAEFVLFQYTVAGQGMVTFEGRTMPVNPGQALLLTIPHDSRYWVENGQSWKFFYVCLHGRDVMQVWRRVIANRGPLVDLDERSQALKQAALLCEQGLSKEITSPFQASALAHGLSMALADETLPQIARQAPAPIGKAIDFCRANFNRPIGVEDIAAAAGMSRFHFSRRFQAARGISPGKFLADLRLQEAVRLMQSSNLPVATIAETCGYTDANYFCKVFRKGLGVSPGAFRKNGMY